MQLLQQIFACENWDQIHLIVTTVGIDGAYAYLSVEDKLN